MRLSMVVIYGYLLLVLALTGGFLLLTDIGYYIYAFIRRGIRSVLIFKKEV